VVAIPSPRPHKEGQGPPLLGALLPHLNRIKTLSVGMSQKVYGTDHLLAEVTVPSLERLCIIASSEDPTYPADWIPRLFMGNTQAPRLQHLCLIGIPLTSPFKFRSLSRLRFERVPSLESKLPAVLEMLACNPNLRELLLSGKGRITNFDLQPLSKPYIRLHSLQKFRVANASAPVTAYLFSALELEESGLALDLNDIYNTTAIFAAMFPPTFPCGPPIFRAPKVELDCTGNSYLVIQTTGPASSVRIEAPIPHSEQEPHAARVLGEQHPRPHVVKELWVHARYPASSRWQYFIPRSQEFPNVETLVIKSSESAIIDELRFVIGPEGKYPLLSTLVLYVPCWTFVGFRKFAEVLRHHHANLRTVRVGAVVWVDREAVVKVLGDIAEDNGTLAYEVDDLNLHTDFGGMKLPEVCTVGWPPWLGWKCGIHRADLAGLIEERMQNIFSHEIDLDRWSQIL